MPSIEQRLTQLEDIEAIRQLKARYCDVCDNGHDPDAIVELFAPDGVWENGAQGPFEGHDEIRSAFERFGRSITFSQHNAVNLDVKVDGDRASGTWHFVGFLEFARHPTALSLARYDEEYVKLDGAWKFNRLSGTFLASSNSIELKH